MHLSIVTTSTALARAIARDAQAVDAALQLHVRTGDTAAAARELRERQPELLALELPHAGAAELAELEAALSMRPGTALILLTPEAGPDTLLAAMRAGVREVLPLPLGASDFAQACTRQLQRLRTREAAGGGASQARTFAFLPAKGGAGATFLATNFAHALARQGRRVVVIDLHLHGADAALQLTDQVPSMTLADLVQQEARLDGALFDSALLSCAPGLKLLAAPERLEQVLAVRPEPVARILQLARARFDEVVVDLGRTPDAVTLRALDFVDQTWLVVQACLPQLHGARRLLASLRELGCQPRQLGLVLNRSGRGAELEAADFRRSLGVDELREVPDSPTAVAHAVDHGLPIAVHAPRDPVARALASWAAAAVPAAAASPRNGWLRGLARRRAQAPSEPATQESAP